ncbi:hypothetical protein N7520_010188 [Penicillium odoratum]|uniref:uncharacterized protein n=1 Tax=Penicillium odoratum TaxID=1167516 RepID=UPI0025473438|nr:uncharacterized protein N7520_010188 [Penicillium odoratum]KAJ5753271.1 hypothetical protein N7520_010188 [Penicillium odoratum]
MFSFMKWSRNPNDEGRAVESCKTEIASRNYTPIHYTRGLFRHQVSPRNLPSPKPENLSGLGTTLDV